MASIAVVAIKGNHLARLPELVTCFDLVDLKNDKRFDDFETTANYLEQNHLSNSRNAIDLMAFWFNSGWTMICDPKMVVPVDKVAMEKLSQFCRSIVFTFFAQTAGTSFGFAKYDGSLQRKFFTSGGQIKENSGQPLKEEEGLNVGVKMFTNDIFNLGQRLGVNMYLSSKDPFIVKELGHTDVLKQKLEAGRQ